jgi:hypothetical protein
MVSACRREKEKKLFKQKEVRDIAGVKRTIPEGSRRRWSWAEVS